MMIDVCCGEKESRSLRNILAGYQCGTAYKPDYLEARKARRRWRCSCGPG